MLTLHAPRATARLTLNVKGFNMGDNSPWQTKSAGRRIRPAGLPRPLLGKSTAPPSGGRSRAPGASRPNPSEGTSLWVLPSPRRGVTLASHDLISARPRPPLSSLRVLYQGVTATKIDDRRDKINLATYTEQDGDTTRTTPTTGAPGSRRRTESTGPNRSVGGRKWARDRRGRRGREVARSQRRVGSGVPEATAPGGLMRRRGVARPARSGANWS
jgi:hypothetical protein